MASKLLKRLFRGRLEADRGGRPVGYRMWMEPLEKRVLLAAGLPPVIVVGRTLSSYTTAAIQNNQETITYTVYNQQTNPLTGVLLTDTLQAGIALLSASNLPDQSGQNLAWSLGTINGYDRASVTLTVSLPASPPAQLDTGAKAFGMVDAGAVSDSAPAAALRIGSVGAGLLDSTPDANTTDPFIQEKAAELDYNAQNIYSYLHANIGYNSYLGSVRGARGTLWSSAGNALDVASLGIALMRASGIPAQYVQGSLPSYYAQTLILSMFPASYQTVGYIPAGTATANPANDPQLLAETEAHFWFQFDTGTGFQNADPLLASFAGQTFTTSQATFTVVPDNLREKTEVTLNAEMYTQAGAAFGGSGLKTTTVLDQTFNDVDLVGRLLTVGHFVKSTAAGGLAFSTYTNTYSPFLQVDDEAYADPSQDQLIRGTDYQEILTNFPLGGQFLTGLFLNFNFSGPQGAPVSNTKTLVDRIGYDARQNGGSAKIAPINPAAPPIVADSDLWTVSALPGLQSAQALGRSDESLSRLQSSLTAIESDLSQIPATGPINAKQMDAEHQAQVLGQQIACVTNEILTILFMLRADRALSNLETGYKTKSYYTTPRILVATLTAGTTAVTSSLDILKNDLRDLPSPGQPSSVAFDLEVARGIDESVIEGEVGSDVTGQTPIAIAQVLAALDGHGTLIKIDATNLQLLESLPLSAVAKSRITSAVSTGKIVFTPSTMVEVNGQQTVGWLEIDPTTGHTISVFENGGHDEALEYLLVAFYGAPFEIIGSFIGVLHGFADTTLLLISKFLDQQPLPKPLPDKEDLDTVSIANDILGDLAAGLQEAQEGDLVVSAVGGLATGFEDGFKEGINVAKSYFAMLGLSDPPVVSVLLDTDPVERQEPYRATKIIALSPNSAIGALTAHVTNAFTRADEVTEASWTSTNATFVSADSFSSSLGVISRLDGSVVGSGRVELEGGSGLQFATIGGSASFLVTGDGNLSFYGPAGSTLGVSAEWSAYSAAITGNFAVSVTTDALSLNGIPLPSGTYTISASAATLTGNGATTSPNFSGSASITTTTGTVDLGPGTGTLTIGGAPVNPANGTTLTGYTGTITVAANGNGADTATLAGNAANVLTVATTPASVTTDQNTPVTFQTNVKTSFADSYTITAQAPVGWTVRVDNSGNVTATPAAGLQSGTYPVQIIAQSTTNPDLVAQSIVNVTIKSSQAGITLNVVPDTLTTVPFNGAQLPTAFNAQVHNSGPLAITVKLTLSNLPSGFTLLDSGASMIIPAGQTGSLGLYLVPMSQIPAPGSQYTFTVTAAVSFGPTVVQNVTFTVPEVHGITLTPGTSSVNATPGNPVTESLTITNVGNVPDTISLTASVTAGLTVGGQSSVTLQPGQSVTQNVTLTPAATTPLNTFLQATFTATFGPVAAPQTETLQIPVDVVVPGALAIAQAVDAATKLGELDLANRLTDLGTELTTLVLTSGDGVTKSQVLASLDALIGLLAGDFYVVGLTGALTTDRGNLAAASAAADIGTAIQGLGVHLNTLATTLSDELKHRLTIKLDPNQGQARPNQPVLYPFSIQNNGNQATTYDLSVSGLPAGLTASFNFPSVTLQPGQFLYGGSDGPVLTVMETANNLVPAGFTVTATAEGAPEIQRSDSGALVVRSAFVQITAVTTSPSFTNAGQAVAISAKVFNILNQPLQTRLHYTISDAAGNLIFTSPLTPLTLSRFDNILTIALAPYDTTGLAQGSYTINVIIADLSGNTLTATPGQGSLLIGSPVTASLSTETTIASANFPYPQNYKTTLKVDAASGTFPPPLTLTGFAATDAPESSVALSGSLAYLSGTKDISIVDRSDPSNPMVVGTVGADVITPGSFNLCRVAGSLLLVGSQNTANVNSFNLLIYSIIDPLHPVLLSNTGIPYHFLSGMIVDGTTVYFPTSGISTFVNVILTDQYGDFVGVDFSNPAHPSVSHVLFNNRGPADGSDHQVNGGVAANGNVAYAATTTSAGTDTAHGTGRLLVIDTSDPTHTAVLGTLDIPNTLQLLDISVNGTQALAIGSTGGTSIASGASTEILLGNLTLTPLDISDPLHPRIIGPTVVTQDTFFNRADNLGVGTVGEVSLGGGMYAISDTKFNGSPVLLLANMNDPNHVLIGAVQTPSPVSEMTVAGGNLYAAGQEGLSIYTIGQVTGIPTMATVNVPTGTGVVYDPTSFNISPTQIVHGNGFDTLSWLSPLGAGVTDLTITWESGVSNLSPGEARAVTLGGSVNFISENTPGAISLPGTMIDTGNSVFMLLSPSTITVRPGQTATYTIELENSQRVSVTYNLALSGLASSWATLPATATVPDLDSLPVPLRITTDPSALPGTYTFSISASAGNLFNTGSLTLVLQGAPVLPVIDPDSHGDVVTLIPATASAGPGTPGQYVARIVNTGSAVDSFALSATGLPAGVAAVFGESTVSVSPGASNYQDMMLTLTPPVGMAAGSYGFTIAATSTAQAAVASTANGTLIVLGSGVSVALTPSLAGPGGTFQFTVTNSGASTDTFNLALGGPAALFSQLASTQVTLLPGGSQVVAITPGAVNLAVPGPLTLIAMATSQANPAIGAEASANLTVPITAGMTASFNPPSQSLPLPGTATFLMLVNNTGNTEDSYAATITGTTGGVSATLIGLDGQPTASLPLFRLPGLSTGQISLQASLAVVGQGTVTIQIKSLSNGAIVSTQTATVAVTTLAPTASAMSVSTNENAPIGVTLTGSDPNSPSLSLTYVVTNGPLHGGLTGIGANLTYTPSRGYFGPDSFSFRANNGFLDSAMATVAINVSQIPASISGRFVFYNNSAFDNNDPTINAADDGAITTDKQLLLPGQTATFANYTSYSKGINGLMIDIGGVGNGPALTASDFTFKVGNGNDPTTWTTAPAPAMVLDRPGAGTGGSDRIELVWADGAIQKQWLQVTVMADANTGLALPDVFYFGNAVGSIGDSSTSAAVNSADDLGARTNKTGLGTAAITNLYDFNRDKHVDTQDELIARSNHSGLNPLKLITVPAPLSPAAEPAVAAIETKTAAPVPLAVAAVSDAVTSGPAATVILPAAASVPIVSPAAPGPTISPAKSVLAPATTAPAPAVAAPLNRAAPAAKYTLTAASVKLKTTKASSPAAPKGPPKASPFSIVRIPIIPEIPKAVAISNDLLGVWTGAVWAERRASWGIKS